MKVLIVSQYFWPENFRINDLALALKDKGHEVTVLTGMPNYPKGKLYDGYNWWDKRRDVMEGVPIVRVPLFTRRKSKSWQLALNYISFALSGCLFGSWLLRKQKFDIVFTYEVSPVTVGIPAILMRKIKRAPMLFWVQDLWPETLSATGAIQSESILSAVRYLVKKIYHSCDSILVQSKGFIEPALQSGADKQKVQYYPNWAESLYKPVTLTGDAIERSEVPTMGFVAMFAGNLGGAQSLETIIKAADLLKDKNIHWVFLGDGRRRAWLEAEVNRLQLQHVYILGSRPMETMPNYFSLADAMLVTLKDDPVMANTIPGKVQSYLACGRPVVGALNGSGAEVILDSKAGYCVPADDYKGFAEAVLKVVNASLDERHSMSVSALSYYQSNFDREMLISKLDDLMTSMIMNGNKQL